MLCSSFIYWFVRKSIFGAMYVKSCFFIFMLLCLILPALSDKCPNHDRLPTTCECVDEFLEDEVDLELSCSGSTLMELRDALNLIEKYTRLEVQLDDMTLDPLPSDIFDGWNVVKLDISHCELDSLSYPGQVALAGLENKLKALVIVSSFSEENQYTKIDLSHLHSLRELDLSFNSITELNDDWFARGPPSLTHLTLSNNGIGKMGDQAFANLVNLKHLALHGNRFGNLKKSMLPKSAERLENLELDNNDFSSFSDDLFTDMPALKELSIRTNGITHLQEQAFKPIWSQLDVFDARGNPLECDSTMEWMFRVPAGAIVLGTCEGPLGRKGVDLEDFIDSRGQYMATLSKYDAL